MIIGGLSRVIGFPGGHKRRGNIGNYIHGSGCGTDVACGIGCGIGDGVDANGAGIDGATCYHFYTVICVVCCTCPGVYIGRALYESDRVSTIERNNGCRVIDIGDGNHKGYGCAFVVAVAGSYCDVVNVVIAIVLRVFEIGCSDKAQAISRYGKQCAACTTESVGERGAVCVCDRDGGYCRGVFRNTRGEVAIGDHRS